VIKNLQPSTDISFIKSELSALGFQARNINNVRHRQSKLPLPIFFIDLEPDSANSAIFKLTSLCFTKIKVEGRRGWRNHFGTFVRDNVEQGTSPGFMLSVKISADDICVVR